ncbi:DUF1127 domain-containing protein [Pseudoxanthobacter sp. M-2]|jgi:uncharacterized protein YjiS (DUF1127 family)|uniref:DUF1127 domain-containing protein n=1 Tax=Pseudoxanthobacter sp. M-2 TaxID=3078754 RepID=UPI0038FCDF6F
MPNAARRPGRKTGRRVPCKPGDGRKTSGVEMIDSLVKSYRSWRKYRSTYEELMKLSSRELDDLGITRAEIPNIARRVAH